MKELLIKKIYPDAVLPTRGTAESAGLDLYAYLSEPLVLTPMERRLVPTGVAVALPDQYKVGLIFARSSLGVNNGITLPNSVGVIDADYRGELHVALVNLSDKNYEINCGDRIAQLVIVPVFTPELLEVEELPPSKRGNGGFGSTGK